MAREKDTSHTTNNSTDDSLKPAPITAPSQAQDDACATSFGKSKRKTIKYRSKVWDHLLNL